MSWSSAISETLWRSWAYLTHTRMLAVGLGIAFAIVAIALLVASRTRWGQSKPLTKCIALSVLAHVWLLLYALGSRSILPQGNLQGKPDSLSVSFEGVSPVDDLASVSREAREGSSEPAQVSLGGMSGFQQAAVADVPEAAAAIPTEPLPWERPVPLAKLSKPSHLETLMSESAISAPALLQPLMATPMPALPPEEAVADATAVDTQAAASRPADSGQSPVRDPSAEPAAILPPSMEVAESKTYSVPPSADSLSPVRRPTTTAAHADSTASPQVVADPIQPPEYQLRQATNRLQIASAYGADADSEAAVEAALQWLARAQSNDGSWDAARFGGGTETRALGESRGGTGAKADTGVSALALLAFLSAGHTHTHGQYQTQVRRGFEYLLRAQMPSGDLSGPKQVGSDLGILNARMYCHSISTLALAEAHAMTDDRLLRNALLRATQYSLNAQDVQGGGWRYRARDPGDLSQFGWQAMALKSAERSGISIPVECKQRMRRFLDSCVAGRFGGLATYRPGEGRPSETMTAEALACRLLMEYPLSPTAQQEAVSVIMRSRPGVGQDNVYFWYYATLALFRLQDAHWREWNLAMKQQLLSTQIPPYADQPGSWDPDEMWGGYGGRVYSTAMSCLCLEVYYRYLPLYQRGQVAHIPELKTHR